MQCQLHKLKCNTCINFPGLFNNGVRTYGEYILKGEALYEVFILLVCLNLLHIADGCIPPHFIQEYFYKQLVLKYLFLKLKS